MPDRIVTPHALRTLYAHPVQGSEASLIAFTSVVEWLGVDEFGKRENWNVDSEVYTVRPDGSDLQQVTDSGPHGVDRGAPVQVGASSPPRAA